jgi:ABC-type transport system involved in cytochrome c biogenesis ATPase subunit
MRCTAESVTWAPAGVAVFSCLSFDLRPGLTLVRGGDGRGKTGLLRLLAGTLAPSEGTVRREAGTVWFEDLSDAVHDPVVARDWLAARRSRFPDWNDTLATDLFEALSLGAHLDKPLYMLSTGSRRKVGLVGAVASGATLTLLDTPYAALDGRSCRVLDEVLTEAAGDASRTWVVADHAFPPGLFDGVWSGVVDLGD